MTETRNQELERRSRRLDWGGYGSAPLADAASNSAALPHSNLYTRLRPSAHGVGVFAIRKIPQGIWLFEGDAGATVAIPASEVEKIEDAELRRIYFDFCPFIDGFFIAPADFNQLTMGWYLNHSAAPNVAVDRHGRFFANRQIEIFEELTTNYASFSENASGIRLEQI